MDVAGGTGQLSMQTALKYPHLRGIVMDLPPVLKIAEEKIAANGLTGRFRTETADLFEGPYPSGADVITLSWILHDWNDDNCQKILRHCFNALPPAGVLPGQRKRHVQGLLRLGTVVGAVLFVHARGVRVGSEGANRVRAPGPAGRGGVSKR